MQFWKQKNTGALRGESEDFDNGLQQYFKCMK